MAAGKWRDLAEAVKRRREQLRLRQRDVELRGGPGPGTMRNIEQATRDGYALRTFAALERALEWPQGTVASILEGTATAEEIGARSGDAFAAAPVDAPQVGDHMKTIGTVIELLDQLAGERHRTSAMDDAVAALSRLLPELWGWALGHQLVVVPADEVTHLQ